MNYRKQLNTKEWKQKRIEILDRDGHKCTKCGSTVKLTVHHIQYNSIYKDAWNYPNELLVTLCNKCHTLFHKSKSSNDNETFGMHRTTEGVDWVFQFTGIELQMMIVLLEIEDLKTGIVSLTPLMKQHISSKFEKTGRYMREIIASLESKNALYKITTQDIILNPIFMYKGGTKVFKTKLNTYNSYKNKPSSI